MELIPILSLIILVATISTFILAVGAYILYKVRERKGVTAQAAQPAALPAELVTPAPLMAEFSQQEQGRGPELRPTFVGSTAPTQGDRYQRPTSETSRNYETDHGSSKKKFMRYTNEGYVEPSQQQERKQEDNLRWR